MGDADDGVWGREVVMVRNEELDGRANGPECPNASAVGVSANM